MLVGLCSHFRWSGGFGSSVDQSVYRTVKENEIAGFLYVQNRRRTRIGDNFAILGSWSISTKNIHIRRGNSGKFACADAPSGIATIVSEYDIGDGVAGSRGEPIQAVGDRYYDIDRHFHVAAAASTRCGYNMVAGNCESLYWKTDHCLDWYLPNSRPTKANG